MSENMGKYVLISICLACGLLGLTAWHVEALAMPGEKWHTASNYLKPESGDSIFSPPSLTVSDRISKRDILGIYPGMLVSDANAITNKWKCTVADSFSRVKKYACEAPAGLIYVVWGDTTGLVYEIELRFDAGGDPDNVALSVGSQFGVSVERLKEAKPYFSRGYKASLPNGIQLELDWGPYSPAYRLRNTNPDVMHAEEIATQRKDQLQSPAPRF